MNLLDMVIVLYTEAIPPCQAIVGRLCQTPIPRDGVSQKRPTHEWRDAEADLIARLGGGIGHGSGFRVDFANAQTKLIDQRTEVLKKYL
jgi:hypothetical protein